jgi:hypothetical protein
VYIRPAAIVFHIVTAIGAVKPPLPCSLLNHAPVVNLVSNPALFDRALRLNPSLGHGTVDNVPLNPSAMRAGKEAPVLASPGWLDRRQLHWRTASGALRALALSVEHCICSLSSVP